MKLKYFILVLLFLQTSSLVFSQEDTVSVNKHHWGVKAGSNFSQINLDIIETTDLINSQEFFNGFSGGLVYRHIPEGHFALQIEMLITKKSGQNYFEKESLSDTLNMLPYIANNLSLTQLEIPFLTVLHFGNKKNKLNFIGGPYVAYTIQNEIEFTGDTPHPQKGFYPEIDRNYELGINGAIGYGRQIGAGFFEAEFRFTQAYTNIYNTKSVNKSLIYQTQALTLYFSYIYGR